MGLTPDRHAEVDAKLQEMHEYLLALALELDEAAPLTAERHAEVDAKLQEIHEYLLALALEIDEAAPLTGKQGHNYQVAVNTSAHVRLLRHTLQTALEHDREHEEIRRRLDGSKQ
jgi:hypothetical protein